MPRLEVSRIIFVALFALYSTIGFAAEKVSVQLNWTHQFEFAGVYAALEKGFYKQEGLEVEIKAGGPGITALSEVLTGSAQFGISGSELLLARISGQPVVALGVIFQHSAAGIVALADSDIYTPQDFSGRRLEIGELSSDAEAYAVLQAEGITPRQYEHIPSTFNMQKLISKQVDAASVYITNQPFYLKQQNLLYRLILPRSYGIDFYGDTIFTSETLLEEQPELARAFMNATLRGWKYAFDRPDEIIDLILEKYSDFPFAHSRKHLEYEYQQMKELVLPDLVELGHMNLTRWRHMANTFVSLGLLQPDYSLEGFIWQPDRPTKNLDQHYFKIGLILALSIGFMLLLLFFYNRRLQEQTNLRAQADSKLVFTEQKQQMSLWASNQGYWHWNRVDNTLFIDQNAATFLGGQHQATVFSFQDVSSESNIVSVRNFFSYFSDQVRQQAGRFELEAELSDEDNLSRWLVCRGEIIETSTEGGLKAAHGVLLDVTEQRKAQQQLEQLAITDTMTGCLNRRYFMSRLSAFMQRVKFGEGHFAIALIDIDKMENINAEYGEHTGDHVIETLADIIQQQVRPMDLVARFGGQAYAVLMPNTNTADAINACDRISNYIAHYRFDTSNNSFFVTVTGGIVDTEEFSLTELNSKQLLFLAEERVKEGKSQGGNRLITDHRSH